MDTLRALPAVALVALGLLAVVQLSLQIGGLVDLARRPKVLGDRKWVWAIVIVLGGLVGAAAYLALARNASAVTAGDEDSEAPRLRPPSSTRSRSIDRLYGGRGD